MIKIQKRQLFMDRSVSSGQSTLPLLWWSEWPVIIYQRSVAKFGSNFLTTWWLWWGLLTGRLFELGYSAELQLVFRVKSFITCFFWLHSQKKLRNAWRLQYFQSCLGHKWKSRSGWPIFWHRNTLVVMTSGTIQFALFAMQFRFPI
jgi:hypothetical protein